jgi:hypothetical protein
MHLTGCKKAVLTYVLLNTPEELTYEEKHNYDSMEKQYRIKTEYHHLSVYYDEDYIMCKDCFKQTHKCKDCVRPFIPEKFEVTMNDETNVIIKSRCRDCDYENFVKSYKENWLGLTPKDPRWKLSYSELNN